MSRSHRHTPIVPPQPRGCGKRDKKMWHAVRRMLERVQDARLPPDERYPVSKHDAINQYDLHRDDWCWWYSRSAVGTETGSDTLRAWYHGYAK